jgi:hypothetical protein
MKFGQPTVVFVSLLLATSLFLSVNPLIPTKAQSSPDVYVGVDLAYSTNVSGAESLINQVSNYTNFFVLGATSISMNLTSLNATLQYAYDKGMYFMSFPPSLGIDPGLMNASLSWLNYSESSWGNHLMGFIYPYEDEPGGHQLDDSGTYYPVQNMTQAIGETALNQQNYTAAEAQYINSPWFLDLNHAKSYLNRPLFTSDYAAYWFDYLGGYDGVFAEFGWNYSRQLNVALCRGAATVQNKQWGVIITYTYTNPPYMESADQLYNDMVYAYDNGAKYIVVLDTNANYTAGCLTEAHFQAIAQFWQYVQDNPRNEYPVTERVAYELPEGFAFGFRGYVSLYNTNDKVWGIWNSDTTSFMLDESVSIMLQEYGSKLDIIYDEPGLTDATYAYSNIIYWNDPTAVANAWQSFSPWPGLTPTESPTATPDDSPTEAATTSTPQSSVSLDASPTSPPSQSPQTTSTPNNTTTLSIPEVYLSGILAFAVVTCVFGAAFILRRKYPQANSYGEIARFNSRNQL